MLLPKILPFDEDSASASLAYVLDESIIARQTFLKLGCSSNVPEDIITRLSVETQHRTDQGRRIDILLSHESWGLIIECKVRDKQKPWQLEHYREYWLNTRRREPLIFWLVQSPQRIMGEGNSFARTLTWNQLRDALTDLEIPAERERKLIHKFCSELDSAGITLNESTSKVRRKITKGYDQNHAEFILNSIRDRIPGLMGSVEEVNECPPCLKVGRIEWDSKFHWVKRAWLYMKPLQGTPNTTVPFGFKVDVLLFHAGNADTYDKVKPYLSRWSRACHDSSLVFFRNAPGKWNKQLPLSYPFLLPLGIGLKWIAARQSLEIELDTGFNWKDDEAAIEAGRKKLNSFLKIIDRF